MEKVSVIIPTFNRFKYLMNTIESVKKQTYNNLEIIVVNDRSTQKEYYDYDWNADNIIIIHLEQNSKQKFDMLVQDILEIRVLKYQQVNILHFATMMIYGYQKK